MERCESETCLLEGGEAEDSCIRVAGGDGIEFDIVECEACCIDILIYISIGIRGVTGSIELIGGIGEVTEGAILNGD